MTQMTLAYDRLWLEILTTVYQKELGNETSGINKKQGVEFFYGGDITNICRLTLCAE
jgi:hypothetical protein